MNAIAKVEQQWELTMAERSKNAVEGFWLKIVGTKEESFLEPAPIEAGLSPIGRLDRDDFFPKQLYTRIEQLSEEREALLEHFIDVVEKEAYALRIGFDAYDLSDLLEYFVSRKVIELIHRASSGVRDEIDHMIRGLKNADSQLHMCCLMLEQELRYRLSEVPAAHMLELREGWAVVAIPEVIEEEYDGEALEEMGVEAKAAARGSKLIH